MHNWGDEDMNWKGLAGALDIIQKKLRFWRVPVRQVKEKFGCVRVYCSLGWNSLHDICYPGYAHYRFPKWLVTFDIFVLSRIVPYLNCIVLPLHKWAYRNAYRTACEKYPHLVEEICCMADFRELLTFYTRRKTDE